MNLFGSLLFLLPSFNFRLDFETNHPAVTIKFKRQFQTTVYDVDLAPVIKIQNWPQALTWEWEHRRRNGTYFIVKLDVSSPVIASVILISIVVSNIH